MLGQQLKPEHWLAESKPAPIIETAPLSEAELSAYYHERGLYPDQVKRWKAESLQGFQCTIVFFVGHK